MLSQTEEIVVHKVDRTSYLIGSTELGEEVVSHLNQLIAEVQSAEPYTYSNQYLRGREDALCQLRAWLFSVLS